jgi:hypothetical protein
MPLTPADIKDGFPTTVSDAEIQLLINFFDRADACLEANGVDEDTANLLKTYAVRHLLALQANSGRGNVRSESAPSGAGRSFASWVQGKGLDATSYGAMLKMMDAKGCVRNVIDNDGQAAFMNVGPKRERGGR